MNINTKSSGKLNNPANAKPVETAETAGSLAYNSGKSWFAVNVYDTFTPSNPFSLNIDFSNYTPYSDGGETVASSNFMAGFASAVATVGTDCSGVSAGGCAGFAGASSGASCSSGGFTSFV